MSVEVSQKGKVMTVIIVRPEVRNAVDRPTAEALADAFRDFEALKSARAAVLYGAGGNFCAGADLKGLSDDQRRNRAEDDGDGPMGPSRLMLTKPVIAAVAGYAVAGGLELALWCDLRVAEKSAVFGVYCRRWGVPLIDGGTVRLPRAIGMSRALDMILTGRGVGADEALAWGLANRVVDDGASREEAEKLAAELAEFPQTCLQMDRISAYEQWGLNQPNAIRNEFHRGLTALKSPEISEGVGNFTGGKGRHGK
ncbi:MAG TPA: crotonase/enoyl-CoA hydratase family protein [bacterium]|nr:crotonase/enoyl-CoA hydratase family protein [bacterium]